MLIIATVWMKPGIFFVEFNTAIKSSNSLTLSICRERVLTKEKGDNELFLLPA